MMWWFAFTAAGASLLALAFVLFGRGAALESRSHDPDEVTLHAPGTRPTIATNDAPKVDEESAPIATVVDDAVERTAIKDDASASSISGLLRLAGGGRPGVETTIVAIPTRTTSGEVEEWFTGRTDRVPDGVLVTNAASDGTFRFENVRSGEQYLLAARGAGVVIPDPVRVFARPERFVVAAGFGYGVEVEARDVFGRPVGIDRPGSYRSNEVVASWRASGRLLEHPSFQFDAMELKECDDVGESLIRRYFVVAPERVPSIGHLELTLAIDGFAPTMTYPSLERIDLGLPRHEVTLLGEGARRGAVVVEFLPRGGPGSNARYCVPRGTFTLRGTSGASTIDFAIDPELVGDDLRYPLTGIPCDRYEVSFVEETCRETLPIRGGTREIEIDAESTSTIVFDASALGEMVIDLATPDLADGLERGVVRVYVAGGKQNLGRDDSKLRGPRHIKPRERIIRIPAMLPGEYVIVVTDHTGQIARRQVEISDRAGWRVTIEADPSTSGR